MQATNQIVANSSNKASGFIAAFNNTANPVIINESSIFVSNVSQWNFHVDCDGHGSKIIYPGLSCSISFISNSIVSTPTMIQISIPVTDLVNKNSVKYTSIPTETINTSTTLVPYLNESLPYLVYLQLFIQ